MSDRLTQLQVCLDQLVEQFNATVNYVNTNCDTALLDPNPLLVANIAANAPLPGQTQKLPSGSTKETDAPNTGDKPRDDAEANFDSTINELSTDIILKSRQISMLIDLLPGIGASPDAQLLLIDDLIKELHTAEEERVAKIKGKDELLAVCEGLIMEVATGILSTREA